MWVSIVWLGQLVGPLALEPVLFLVHKLVFWSPFPMKGYLALPRYRRKDLSPAPTDVTDFVDYPWEASPSQRSE